MTRFQYVQPGTVETAVAILRESGPDARLLAGGTDLLVRLRSGHIRPALVIDVKRIEALEPGIRPVDSVLRIGARCTMTELIADARVRRYFPALVEAARVVGSVQIRNRATLAGNICNASPAADTAPALLAYGATVNIMGGAGERTVPLSSFFTGPGKTVLQRDELVTSIDLPVPGGPVGAAFMRLTRRRGVDLATLTVCCAVSPSGEVRVGLGAVAPTPLLVTVENGRGGSHEFLNAEFVTRIAAHASPISDVRAGRDYRAAMLPVFIRRALEVALERLDENLTWNPPDSRSSSQ